jgi:hypothetical protein
MKPVYPDGVKIHTQYEGGVVATYDLGKGRVMRVCGEKEYRGCSVAGEMYKVLQFERRIPRG